MNLSPFRIIHTLLFFIACNSVVAQVGRPAVLSVERFAGTTSSRGSINGAKLLAKLNEPIDMAITPSGIIYVAEENGSSIKVIDTDGIVSNFVGSSGVTGFVDGTGSSARFNQIRGITLDINGNIIVADKDNHAIRKVTPAGVVTTLAGSTAGFQDGSLSEALFNKPIDVLVDNSNNIYVGDALNYRIRKIDSKGTVTTIAGLGISGYTDGNTTAATLDVSSDFAFDSKGDLIIATYYAVRRLNLSTNQLTTIVGGATATTYADGSKGNAGFNGISGLFIDEDDNIYIIDRHGLRHVASDGTVTTLAGDAIQGANNGSPLNARFHFPRGIVRNSEGDFLVADKANHVIRKISLGPGVRISGSVTTHNSSSPIQVTFTFTKTVNNFTASDITTNNGTVSNFSGSGSIYTADVTPNSSSQVTVDVDSNLASDLSGNMNTAAFQLVIIQDSDAPVFTSPTTVSFAENGAGTAYTATATDDNTITYSLGTGNDEGLFDIVSETGVVTFKTAPDFEAPADADTDNGYVIEVKASDGINTVNQTVTTSVTNLDEAPILAGSGRDRTHTEAFQTESTFLFDNISVSTVEPGQLITSFSIEMTNIAVFPNAGSFETFDGGSISLSNTFGTTQNNGLTMSRQVVGGVNTMTFSKNSGITTDVFNTILNNARYNFAGRDPDTQNIRTFVLKEVTDNGSNTAANNNSGAFSITSNVTLIATDTEPFLNTTPINPSHYVGNDPVKLFKETNASAVEADQKTNQIELIVNNLVDGVNELIFIDDQQFTITNGQSGLTTSNGVTVNITVNGQVATVKLSSNLGFSDSVVENLINDIGYSNTNQTPVANTRGATLIKITDTGNNTGNDKNSQVLSITSTINLLNATVPVPIFTSATTANFEENGTGAVYSAGATSVNNLTYSLGTGNDEALFDIVATTGVVTFKASPDFETPTDANTDNDYVIEVKASDGINTVNQTVTITVTNVDDTDPVFTSVITESFAENGTGTAHTVAANDANTLTYSLGTGNDEGLFDIVGTSGVITFKESPDFEAPADRNTDNDYVIEVKASDGINTVSQTVTITVTNVDDTDPIFTSGITESFAENGTGTAHTIVATDANAITYSLGTGNDEAIFDIDGTSGIVTFKNAPDFEAPADGNTDNDYVIEVKASDGINTVGQTVTITVTNGNDKPIFTSNPVITVDDNTDYSYLITASDADADDIVISATSAPDWLSLKKTPKYYVTTLAGSGVRGTSDGTGLSAEFSYPVGVVMDDSKNLYIADQGFDIIRKITPSGIVTTFAGSGDSGFSDGQGTLAVFDGPTDLAIDANGNIYVADAFNHRIRKITPDGLVSTFAGSTSGFADGNGVAAMFTNPAGLTIDPLGNLYVGDSGNNRIRKITPDGTVSTFAGSGNSTSVDGLGTAASFSYPIDVVIDNSSNLFVSDLLSHRIRKVSTNGLVTTVAGSTLGFADGTGTEAKFNRPRGLTVDPSGNIYVADEDNNRIRKITPSGVVTTIAGNGNSILADGIGTNAQFDAPTGLLLNENTFYVTDASNHRIRSFNLNEINELEGSAIDQSGMHQISLTASDGNGGITTQSFTLSINDVTNPIFTSGITESFVENGAGTAHTVAATDANDLTYSLGTGNDEALFDIIGTSGIVTFKTSPDFEVPADANTDNAYVIQVNASDGINTASQAVTITVTNVGEALLRVTGDLTISATALGLVTTFDIIIHNDGDADLTVDNISYPDGFSGISTTSIAASGSQVVTISFAPTEAKTYQGDIVITSNGGEASLSVGANGEVITGVDDDLIDEQDIVLYPNPVSQTLSIDLSEVRSSKLDIELLNAIGNQIFLRKSYTEKSLTIDVSGYQSGIYLMKFSDGKSVVTKKVIIKK